MCALCAFAGCHPNDSVGDSGDDSEYYPPATTQMLDWQLRMAFISAKLDGEMFLACLVDDVASMYKILENWMCREQANE